MIQGDNLILFDLLWLLMLPYKLVRYLVRRVANIGVSYAGRKGK